MAEYNSTSNWWDWTEGFDNDHFTFGGILGGPANVKRTGRSSLASMVPTSTAKPYKSPVIKPTTVKVAGYDQNVGKVQSGSSTSLFNPTGSAINVNRNAWLDTRNDSRVQFSNEYQPVTEINGKAITGNTIAADIFKNGTAFGNNAKTKNLYDSTQKAYKAQGITLRSEVANALRDSHIARDGKTGLLKYGDIEVPVDLEYRFATNPKMLKAFKIEDNRAAIQYMSENKLLFSDVSMKNYNAGMAESVNWESKEGFTKGDKEYAALILGDGIGGTDLREVQYMRKIGVQDPATYKKISDATVEGAAAFDIISNHHSETKGLFKINQDLNRYQKVEVTFVGSLLSHEDTMAVDFNKTTGNYKYNGGEYSQDVIIAGGNFGVSLKDTINMYDRTSSISGVDISKGLSTELSQNGAGSALTMATMYQIRIEENIKLLDTKMANAKEAGDMDEYNKLQEEAKPYSAMEDSLNAHRVDLAVAYKKEQGESNFTSKNAEAWLGGLEKMANIYLGYRGLKVAEETLQGSKDARVEAKRTVIHKWNSGILIKKS